MCRITFIICARQAPQHSLTEGDPMIVPNAGPVSCFQQLPYIATSAMKMSACNLANRTFGGCFQHPTLCMAHPTAGIPQNQGLTPLRESDTIRKRIQLSAFCPRLSLGCPHWRKSQLQASDTSAKDYDDAGKAPEFCSSPWHPCL